MMGDSRNGKDDKWRREEQSLKLVRPVKVEILRRGCQWPLWLKSSIALIFSVLCGVLVTFG